jgi:Uma2 family endonuclease
VATDTIAPWAEPVLFTADDLMALPDDAWRYELVEGRLVRMSPAGFDHGRLGSKLAAAIEVFVDQHGLGESVASETGFLISTPKEPDTVLAPDAAFVSSSRVPPKGTKVRTGYLPIAPDLVVEVASPSQSRPEIEAKAKVWLDAGVRVIWLVWPSTRQVDVWTAGADPLVRCLDESDELDGGEVLPGFKYSLSRLWK